MEEIPEDEMECANWLHKLYQEKARLSHCGEDIFCGQTFMVLFVPVLVNS